MHHPLFCPYGPYPGGRREALRLRRPLAPSTGGALCVDVIDRPDLLDDPRFATNEARVEHRDLLEPILEEAFAARARRRVARLGSRPRGSPAAPSTTSPRSPSIRSSPTTGSSSRSARPSGRSRSIGSPFLVDGERPPSGAGARARRAHRRGPAERSASAGPSELARRAGARRARTRARARRPRSRGRGSGSSSRGSRRSRAGRRAPSSGAPAPMTSTPSGASAAGSGARMTEPVAAERAHDDHAEAELLGERQDLALDLALARVERDLNRVDPPGAHRPARARRRPRRRSASHRGSGCARRRAPRSSQSQVLAPRDEVVHLLEVDVPAVEARAGPRAARAPPSTDGVQIFVATNASSRRPPSARPRTRSARPYIGDESTRRVPPAKAASTTASPTCCSASARSKVCPRAEADDRELDSGAPESAAAPYCLASHAPGEPTRRSRARRALASTRGPPARTSRSPRCSRRAPRARTCARSTASRGSSTTSATRPRAIATRSSTSSSASCDGPPRTEIMRRLHATIADRGLPLEPFRRLIEANRIDQVRRRYETWDDVREYCTYSADPVGRLVLGIYGRAGEPELVGDERRRLHRAPARQLPPGSAARPRRSAASTCRRRTCAASASPTRSSPGPLTRSRSRRCSASRAPAHARFSRRVCRSPRRSAGRAGLSVALYARGGLAALDALERAGWDVFSGRPAPTRVDVRLAGRSASSSADEGRRRLRARSPASPGARRGTSPGGSCVLPRPKRLAVAALYAFARRVDDIADDPELPVEERRRGSSKPAGRAVEALPAAPADDPVLVALADARSSAIRSRRAALARPRRGRADGRRDGRGTQAGRSCASTAAASPGRSGSRARPSTGRATRGAARPRAETLGLALQQINIMRDVAEDWRLGRVYLPQDELERFGVTRGRHRRGPRHRRPGTRSWSIRAARARGALREGLGLLPLLDRRSALCVRTFAGIYARPARRRCERVRLRRLLAAAAALGRRQAAGGRGPVRGRRSWAGASPGSRPRSTWSTRATTVTVLEARPTLGGAVQTLPEREGDPRSAARQRPARRARLLHRVPRLSRARGPGRVDPARAARAAGDRRGRERRPHRAGRARAPALRARLAARSPRGSRGSRGGSADSTPAEHDGETFAGAPAAARASRRRRSTASGTSSSGRR